MARNIFNIYELYRYILRKERGVFVSADQVMANLDSAQLDSLEEWFKLYGQTQQIHDSLRPFRVYQQFTSNAAGFVTFQNDYLHMIGQPFTVTGSTVNRIDFVNEDELAFALTSQLRAVSTSYPIAVDTGSGFSIYPQTVQTGFYWYLRRPATPVLSFTQVGRALTYDAAGSTQLEWGDVYINHIIAKALKYSIANMDEDSLLKFAEEFDKETMP